MGSPSEGGAKKPTPNQSPAKTMKRSTDSMPLSKRKQSKTTIPTTNKIIQSTQETQKTLTSGHVGSGLLPPGCTGDRKMQVGRVFFFGCVCSVCFDRLFCVRQVCVFLNVIECLSYS